MLKVEQEGAFIIEQTKASKHLTWMKLTHYNVTIEENIDVHKLTYV